MTSGDTVKLAVRASRLRDRGYMAEVKPVNAGDIASVILLIRESEAQFGGTDVLHFNSASMHSATIETQTAESFVSDLTINIGAALVATQEVARSMLKRGNGPILLTGGALAIDPNPGYLSLGIGKTGIRNMTHALFNTFKDRGVHIATVTVGILVAPSSRETEGIAEAFWRLHDAPREAWAAEVRYPA